MNSCGSGSLDPSGPGSFPDLFLGKGFSGFIGTETVVPEDYAAEFARDFYDNLLNELTLGKAFVLTRWRLLKGYSNPLGIIYTLFTEPEMGVRYPTQTDLPPITKQAKGAVWELLSGAGRAIGIQ